MLTPTYVNLKSFFYPIGNTPAVNLLCDLRPHNQEVIQLLAIGCGDVRNILFSLWSNDDARRNGCKLNFTVCDMDSAVLARNVFLLTAVVQHATNSTTDKNDDMLHLLWRVYHHFFVTSKDLSFVQVHAKQLHSASKSLSTWDQSPFASTIKFTTESTLSEIRCIWATYAQTRPQHEDTQIRRIIRSAYESCCSTEEGTMVVHGLRSAGVHALEAITPLSEAFHNFWKTGVVAGNDYDVSALRQDNGGRVNPLMSVSSVPSTKFNVHHRTDPLIGFHLAESFDSLPSKPVDMGSLACLAKSQFFDWCHSFASHASSGSLSITHHHGEGVKFGHALQDIKSFAILPSFTRSYIRPWSAVPLALPSTLTTTYDIIDTSNVMDHIGLLNLLPALTPLLSDHPASVLYTESLLQGAKESEQILETLLHSNVTMSSLLFGVSPVGYLLGAMSDSTHAEELLKVISDPSNGRQKQYRTRIPWRRAVQGDGDMHRVQGASEASTQRIRVDPKELASYFMQTYLAMFREAEDISIRFEVFQRKMTRPLANDLGFYSRLSLIALLATAKRTISTDWQACIGELLSMIENDRQLIVGSNSLQELYTHLHASGLFVVDTLMKDPRKVGNPYGRLRGPGETGLLGRNNLPAIVHIVLTVPRRQLRVFTDQPVDEVGTPRLHISLTNGMKFENCYLAFDAFFGNLKEDSEHPGKAFVEEDRQGWAGDSDLLVTCAVPTWSLLLDRRRDLEVSLVVTSSLASIYYTKKLGIHMRVFTANLDSKSVRILSQAPYNPAFESASVNTDQKAAATAHSDMPSSGILSKERRALEDKSTQLTSVTARLNTDGTVKFLSVTNNFPLSSKESQALKSGGIVRILQISPCFLAVSIDQHVTNFTYPLPVDGAAYKSRIARKSSWIEVRAPVSSALQPGGFTLSPFPVIDQGHGNSLAWGFGRVNPDLQPPVRITASSSAYLQPLFSMLLSERERRCAAENHSPASMPAMIQLKETIRQLFLGAAGFRGDIFDKTIPLSVFKDANTYHFFILANMIRHDRHTGSIFLDAFFLRATRDLVGHKSFQALMKGKIMDNGMVIEADDEDIALWRSLIPALIERCRSWDHNENCTYRNTPKPFACDCGLGKNEAQMPSAFRSVAPFATRIAIPLISAVPYVESMGSMQTTRDMVTRMGNVDLGVNAEVKDVCGHCGNGKAGLKACSRCEKVKYCNHACQKAAWKAHKKECRR